MSKAQKKDKKQDVAVYLVTPNKIMLTPKIQHTPREPSSLSDDTIRRMQHHDKASPSKLSQDTNRKSSGASGIYESLCEKVPTISKG